jgi:hypothetical protein
MRPRGQVTIGTPETQPPGRWLTTKTPVESIAGDMPDATVADERDRIQDMQMTGQSAGTIAGSPPLVKGDQLRKSPDEHGQNGRRDGWTLKRTCTWAIIVEVPVETSRSGISHCPYGVTILGGHVDQIVQP